MTTSDDRPAEQPPAALDARHLFAQTVVAMALLDSSLTVVEINEALAAIIGRPTAELVGAHLDSLVHPDDRRAVLQAASTLAGGSHFQTELRLRRDDGWAILHCALTAYHGPDGELDAIVLQGSDLTQLREDEEDSREQRAHVDPLTNLVTRGLFVSLLTDHLETDKGPLAVVALNLDRFKVINAQLGQLGGDAVLAEIGARLLGLLKPGDLAARAGGDDFLVLLPDVQTAAQANAIAHHLLEVVAQPIVVGNMPIQLTASAGVRLVLPTQELSADQVITQANAALGAAKRRGRARFELYDAELDRLSTNRLQIETLLREALEHGGLDVAYQPIRNLSSGELASAEALVRWEHPELGVVTPESFMPIAEETGMVEQLTAFVLGRAVRDAADWRARTGADVSVAVNLSAQDLSRRDFASEVAEAMARAGLPPRALRVEIVETELVESGQRVRSNMAALQALGVSLGIDDFGKGYSSLSYLKHLPVDFVKIDRSYVTGLGQDREDTAIVRAVIALAKSLDLQVVAEGIENPTQMRLLRELGCDLGQGFLIGHAEPPEVLVATITAGAR